MVKVFDVQEFGRIAGAGPQLAALPLKTKVTISAKGNTITLQTKAKSGARMWELQRAKKNIKGGFSTTARGDLPAGGTTVTKKVKKSGTYRYVIAGYGQYGAATSKTVRVNWA